MPTPNDPFAEAPHTGGDGASTTPPEASGPRGAAGPPPVRVRLHARNTVLEFPDGTVTLPVGVGDLARDVLRHDPPTAMELERGIELVEDALAAARVPKTDRGTLVTDDAAVRALPGLQQPEALLPLDAFEALFQRLASRALGTPIAVAELPAGRELAAALLVLRECMHHLGFHRIRTTPE